MPDRIIEVASFAARTLLGNLPGLVSLLGAFVIFILAGAVVSKNRIPILLALCGWAMATLLSIILALLGVRSLTVMFLAMLMLAALGAWRLRAAFIETRGLLSSLVLGVPLLLLAASSPSTFFDAYLHWLPNAQYLTEVDQLISRPLPPGFYSMHDAYPPALALPVYIASRLMGQFATGAAQCLVSVLMVLATQLAALTIDSAGPPTSTTRHWGTALLALAALVLLNPTVNNYGYWPAAQSIQFWSAIGDPALALVTAIALLVVALQLSRPDTVEPGIFSPFRGVAPIGFAVGTLIATLKPNGGVLVVVIAIAVGMVAWMGRLPRREALRTAGLLAVGAGGASTLWQLYVERHLPGGDDLGLRQLEEWRFDLLPDFLRSWWTVVSSNALFHLLTLAGLALGIRGLLKRRGSRFSTLNALAAICGLACLGHLASLVIAFLGIGFEDWAIRSADSVQRYASQIGLASCMAALMLIGDRLRSATGRHWMRGMRAVPFLILTMALYLPTLVAAVGNQRLYQEGRHEVRESAVASLEALPPHVRVAVVGDIWSAIFTRYSGLAEFASDRRPWPVASTIVRVRADIPGARGEFLKWLTDPEIDCVLVLNLAELAVEFGLADSPDHAWCRSDNRWRTLDLGRANPYRFP